MALSRVSCTVCRNAQSVFAKRLLHSSASRRAITNFQMPAMSPTMTEGGIASWKKEEGESFVQGDVLLEIETDKATIDVEAQDDGIMGKILAPDGTKGIPVGKIIALLAEEGDDISNLEAPKEQPPPPKEADAPATTSASSSLPIPNPSGQLAFDSQSYEVHPHAPPTYSRPLFPSVHRLLLENGIKKPEDIKATGVRGMLTKGDVLTFLGKASGPLGTFRPGVSPIEEATQSSTKKAPEVKKTPLDGLAIRRLIVSSMLQSSLKARNPVSASIKDADFDSVLADYLPPAPKSLQPSRSATPTSPKRSTSYLDGLY